jgi:hypothetical protein
MDQDVIENLKVHYHKLLLRDWIAKLGKREKSSPNLLHALRSSKAPGNLYSLQPLETVSRRLFLKKRRQKEKNEDLVRATINYNPLYIYESK